LLRLFDEPEIQAAPAAQAAAPESTPHDGVLEYQAVPGMVLGMGVVGIVAGAAAGVWLAPHPVWGAYLGGLAGWLGGFLFSLLAAMAHEGENATTRCRACRTPFLIARNECPLCGLPVSGISPMTEGFFQAGRYAAESWGVLGRLALWNSLLGATVAGVYLMRQMEDLQPWPWVLGGLAGYVILAFCIETACEAVQTSAHDIRLPLTPSQTPVLIRLLHALLVIGVLALYTAPLLTVPLLPIALMGVCQPKAGAAFSLRHSLSIAWANRKDFLILWLFLFMWGAVIALLVALCVTTLPYLAPLLNTGLDEASNVTLLAVIAALVGLFAGTVCSVLLLAMCRCIGVFAYFVRPYRRPAESAPSPDGKDDSLSPE